MVEISGSGEGPWKATTGAYSTMRMRSIRNFRPQRALGRQGPPFHVA
jgi:hypothetical protein